MPDAFLANCIWRERGRDSGTEPCHFFRSLVPSFLIYYLLLPFFFCGNLSFCSSHSVTRSYCVSFRRSFFICPRFLSQLPRSSYRFPTLHASVRVRFPSFHRLHSRSFTISTRYARVLTGQWVSGKHLLRFLLPSYDCYRIRESDVHVNPPSVPTAFLFYFYAFAASRLGYKREKWQPDRNFWFLDALAFLATSFQETLVNFCALCNCRYKSILNFTSNYISSRGCIFTKY